MTRAIHLLCATSVRLNAHLASTTMDPGAQENRTHDIHCQLGENLSGLSQLKKELLGANGTIVRSLEIPAQI